MKRRFLSVILIICLFCGSFSVNCLADSENDQLFDGTLRTSANGIEMIKELEGFIEKPKHDVSQYSIGYGCSTEYAAKYGFPTDSITEDQAHQLMLFVLDEMEGYLDAFLKTYGVKVNQYQYDALISLTYNLGRSWISSTSRLGKLLVEGNYTVNELASAFGIYCHTGTGKAAVVQDHLVSRRVQETKLFLYGAYNLKDADEKFCRLTYVGNVPPAYSDVALYQEGHPYQILFDPDPETHDGLYFAGWYTANDVKVTADTIVQGNLTVYPKWSSWEEDAELESWAEPYVAPVTPQLTEKQYVNGYTDGETPVDGSGSNTDDYKNQPGYQDASVVFSDISQSAWYYNYVNALYNAGVVNGYEDQTFRPERTVTTGEALKMILLAAGYGQPEQVTEHWASGYLSQALEFGIIERGEITDLDVPISRVLMAKVTANALGLEQLYDISPYTDCDNTYACALHDWGITEGYEDGTFRPDRSLTRAELSTIVWRINNLF